MSTEELRKYYRGKYSKGVIDKLHREFQEIKELKRLSYEGDRYDRATANQSLKYKEDLLEKYKKNGSSTAYLRAQLNKSDRVLFQNAIAKIGKRPRTRAVSSRSKSRSFGNPSFA